MKRLARGLREVLGMYGRIARVYWHWVPTLLLLGAIVFLPIGLLSAVVTEADLDAVDLDSGIQVAAILVGFSLLTATSLLGEVFFAGAVAIGLTRPEHEKPPGLREIARRIDFGKLITIDLIYVFAVIVGLVLAIVPGILAFVFLGLAGPIAEIEHRGIRDSFKRSLALVRGHFWFVVLVLGPIELAGDAIGEGAGHQIHHLLGDSFFATWMAETVADSILSPLFAVALVLITIDLIGRRDGTGPKLNVRPEPVPRSAEAVGA